MEGRCAGAVTTSEIDVISEPHSQVWTSEITLAGSSQGSRLTSEITNQINQSEGRRLRQRPRAGPGRLTS
jgi:hypothetical protein